MSEVCAPKVPDDPRKGFVDERFRYRSPPKAFPFVPSLLSILSLAAMTYCAVHMMVRLQDPSVTFHAPKVEQTKWFKKNIPQTIDTYNEFLHDVPCLVFNYTDMAKDYCHISKPKRKPTGKQDAAVWTLLPFYFTIFGAGLRFALEVGLLLAARPFQHNLNYISSSISRLCYMNRAFVSASTFFFVACMTVPQEIYFRLQMLKYGMVALAFALAPAMYFGGLEAGGYDFMPPIHIAIQAVEFIFVVSRGAVFGGPMATCTLALVPLVQFAAFVVTTSTPIRSIGFNTLSTIASVLLFAALAISVHASPDFPLSMDQTLQGPEGTKVWPFVVLASAFGYSTMMKVAPKVFQNFRSELSYHVWSIVYYIVVGNPAPPQPYRLSAIFSDSNPTRITLQPYAEQHPYDMSPNLGLPAIRGSLPQTVEASYTSLVQKVTELFSLISVLDYFLPQANVDAPLRYKPRMAVHDDGQSKYPSGLFHMGVFPEFPPMGKSLQRCPQPAIDAYREGQLLAWMSQFGIGNTFLKAARPSDVYPYFTLVDLSEKEGEATNDEASDWQNTPALVLDFRYLQAYKYKEDYEPYGGVAFFKVNESQNLELVWLITPFARERVMVREKNQAFRRAESMIVSSMYFCMIAGKHLGEIHMTYNLLEVTAHNSFDVELNRNAPSDYFNAHPLRLYLYIHLFSHGLAEELTTEHLVQKGAVFNQIFAMKYESLIDYLTKTYNDFEFASDEDFVYREALMKPLQRSEPQDDFDLPPFSSCLDWELQYYQIFYRYAEAMAHSIYGTDDANVQNDKELQDFYRALECVFHTMPDRYKQFQTVEGVIRFMADSTNHLVVRHQFYGTTGTNQATDPRLGSTQVPTDGGPVAVDEWRSLAYVALATAYANFVPLVENPAANPSSLLQRPLVDIFEDATPLEGRTSAKTLRCDMKTAWRRMQNDLKKLNNEWIESNVHHTYAVNGLPSPTNWKTDINYMYCRPLPQDLHSGPGY